MPIREAPDSGHDDLDGSSYNPVRLEVTSWLRTDSFTATGLVVAQWTTKGYGTPSPFRPGPHVDLASLASYPDGMVFAYHPDLGSHAYGDYLTQLALELSVGGALFKPVAVTEWYQYFGDEAVSIKSNERLPVADREPR